MKALVILITILFFLPITTSTQLGIWKINPNSKNQHIINFFKNITAGPISDFDNFKKIRFVMVDKLKGMTRKVQIKINLKINDQFEQRNFINSTEIQFQMKIFDQQQKLTQMTIDLNYQFYSVLIENSTKIIIYAEGQQLIYAQFDEIVQDQTFKRASFLILPIGIISIIFKFLFMVIWMEQTEPKISIINTIALVLLDIFIICQSIIFHRLQCLKLIVIIMIGCVSLAIVIGPYMFIVKKQFASGGIVVLAFILFFTDSLDKNNILSILICLQLKHIVQLFLKQREEAQKLFIILEQIISLFIHISLFLLSDQSITMLVTISFLLTLIIINSQALGSVYRFIRKMRWKINKFIEKTQLDSGNRVRDPCFVCYKNIRQDQEGSSTKLQCGHNFHEHCLEMKDPKYVKCPIEGIRAKNITITQNKLE